MSVFTHFQRLQHVFFYQIFIVNEALKIVRTRVSWGQSHVQTPIISVEHMEKHRTISLRPRVRAHKFTFVDLCCGIGGFHIACTKHGGVCIQACDINEGARDIYELNHGLRPEADVNTIHAPQNAKIDLVCFGNPCQSFSSIGKRRGLTDARGKVFFAICRYLEQAQPGAFLMENVKGLVHINGGRDFKAMLAKLEGLGYTVSWAVLNASSFGVPQSRERVFVVGCRRVSQRQFSFERLLSKAKRSRRVPLHGFLDPGPPDPGLLSSRFDGILSNTDTHETPSGFLIKAEIAPYTEKRLFSSHGVIGTIMSSVSPFIYDEGNHVVRNLSVTELLRCQAFPSRFKFPTHINTRNKALKYIGNAVCVNVVSAVVAEMKRQGLIY